MMITYLPYLYPSRFIKELFIRVVLEFFEDRKVDIIGLIGFNIIFHS
jgi:hypothetical protein